MSPKITVKGALSRETPLGTLLLRAFAWCLLAGSLLWLAGELAAFAYSGVWPGTPPRTLPGIAYGIVRNPAEPALAWPEPTRDLLPPAPQLYLVMGAVLAGAWGVRRGTNRLRARWRRRHPPPEAPPPPRLPDLPGDWARPRDLRALVARRDRAGRVVLGTVGGRALAAERGRSVLALGPPGSLKTAGVAAPAVIGWEGPVLAISTRPDLLDATLAGRRRRGEVWVLDPTRASKHERDSWSPLERCGTWAGAWRTALVWAGAARDAGGLPGEAAAGAAEAPRLLAPMLLAAALTGRSMADVARWARQGERVEVLSALEQAGEAAAHEMAAWVWRQPRHRREQVAAAVRAVVTAWGVPMLLGERDGRELSTARLLDGGAHTAYACVPARARRRLGPLVVTLLDGVLDDAYALGQRLGRLTPPLLVVLDDVADLAALPHLEQHAVSAGGWGIQLVTIASDLSQLRGAYGDRAELVVANHHARIVLSGIEDQPTLEFLADLIGERGAEQVRHYITGPTGREAPLAEPPPARRRRLTPPDALGLTLPGQGLLLYGDLPPVPITLRPWFADDRLRALAGGGAPLVEA